MQEKLEASKAGRLLISAFVIVTVGSVIAWNLPSSKLRSEALRAARPYVYATGLDQNWSVFAPNPRSVTLDMYARVTYADRSQRVWRFPSGGALLGAYRDYRWLKWMEWATQDANERLWRPTAEYVARSEIDAGRRPARVELIRRWQEIFPPGSDPAHGPWKEFRFFSARLNEDTA